MKSKNGKYYLFNVKAFVNVKNTGKRFFYY